MMSHENKIEVVIKALKDVQMYCNSQSCEDCIFCWECDEFLGRPPGDWEISWLETAVERRNASLLLGLNGGGK